MSSLQRRHDRSSVSPNHPSSSTISQAQQTTSTTRPESSLLESSPLLGPPVPRINEESADGTSSIVIFWEELRILTAYALPAFGMYFLEFSLITASVVSVGHLSTTALGAISLGAMTANTTAYSIMQGLANALDTMLPSAWTSSQPQLVGLWAQRMTVVLGVALIPIYAIWFNAEPILLSLKQEPEVAHLAASYLRWASIGLPAYAVNCVCRRYFQSQGLFAIPAKITFIVAPINIVLNYLLVWGPQPIRLGFIGAPIATAVSLNLMSLMSIAYGIMYVPHTAWHPLSWRMFTNLGILVRLRLAGAGQTASKWWAWEIINLAASPLGPISLAAQSVLLSSAVSISQAPLSLSVATSVRIGNLLGERKARRAKITCNTSIIMVLGLSAAISIVFIFLRKQWGYLFNNDTEVATLVASVIPVVALCQIFDGLTTVSGGLFRTRGKQVTGAFLNISSYCIIGIPLGLYLTFRRDMELHGLWIGLTVSLMYCAFFGTLISMRTDWDREVWKVTERLKEQRGKISPS